MAPLLGLNMKIKHNYSRLIPSLIQWYLNYPCERTVWQLYDQFKGFQPYLDITLPYTFYLVELGVSTNLTPNDVLMG